MYSMVTSPIFLGSRADGGGRTGGRHHQADLDLGGGDGRKAER